MMVNKLTDKRIAEILARAEICDDSVLTDYADIAAAMREIQEGRKAISKPFGYYSAETPAILERQGYANISADPLADSNKPLYTIQQPEPVVSAGWISCSERMPEKQCDVLAIWNGSKDVLHLDDFTGLWDDGDFNSRIPLEDVTHWMPLPCNPPAR
ncbi:DUF551 domain-containing protein [Serratia ureilytica]|uniref:DUF551 domain-containing protein n=1 Tax=Serratia ureilytica TaxID=300181 RepID=UPI00164F8D75|nr:DUF551 domain-containing protein [Serratia ureilytica]